MPQVITYECDQCGCEVVVTETPETELSPIYCCGFEMTEKAPLKKTAKPKKQAAKKVAKKVVKKVAAKKVAAKKVAAKKPAKKSPKK